MPQPLKVLIRWLTKRYGNKPSVIQGGSPPYRSTRQEIPRPTHFAVLIWRMVMEGADNTANSFFRHWKTIIFLSLLIGLVLCYKPIAASIRIWGYRQEQKAALAAMEAASAQAEKAKLDEVQAKAAASAQAEKAKLDEAKAQAAASASAQAEKAKFAEAVKAAASAQTDKAKVADAQGSGEIMKPRAFYVSERYWVCVHKVVNCTFNNQGDQYDPHNVVRCNPAYSTSGAGFGAIRCPEGDLVQSTFVLKMKNGPEKLPVTVEDYAKYEIGSWVFLMCHQDDKCETKIVDPPPPAPPTSAAPAVSSTPPPQPSAAAPTPDSRGAHRFSLLSH